MNKHHTRVNYYGLVITKNNWNALIIFCDYQPIIIPVSASTSGVLEFLGIFFPTQFSGGPSWPEVITPGISRKSFWSLLA